MSTLILLLGMSMAADAAEDEYRGKISFARTMSLFVDCDREVGYFFPGMHKLEEEKLKPLVKRYGRKSFFIKFRGNLVQDIDHSDYHEHRLVIKKLISVDGRVPDECDF